MSNLASHRARPFRPETRVCEIENHELPTMLRMSVEPNCNLSQKLTEPDRAEYGARLIQRVATDLKSRDLGGLGQSMLKDCRTFYRLYPQIRQPVVAEYAALEESSSPPGRLSAPPPTAQRQIGSLLYDRMVATTRIEKADRTYARSAHYLHSWPINVSIRAKFGESAIANQNRSNSTIDKWPLPTDYHAIEWPAITMSEKEIIAAIEFHRASCPGSLAWFAGVRIAPRIYPWDEQELPFSTNAWIDIPTETPEEAQRIAQRLFALGCGKSPIHTNSLSAKHVFAYVVNPESLN